ncbi:hypothetical protein Bhyg_15223, partial [Pseudolycoriella hygida]
LLMAEDTEVNAAAQRDMDIETKVNAVAQRDTHLHYHLELRTGSIDCYVIFRAKMPNEDSDVDDNNMSGVESQHSSGGAADRFSSEEDADEPDSDDSSEMDEVECERRRSYCIENLVGAIGESNKDDEMAIIFHNFLRREFKCHSPEWTLKAQNTTILLINEFNRYQQKL